jgi:cytochrome c oxidase subunit 3
MDPDAPVVYEQFEHIDQQQESYVLGMWAFLVTEVMFFGVIIPNR